MQSLITPSRHALTLGAAVLTVALGLSAIALADGAAHRLEGQEGEGQVPKKGDQRKKVTCKVVGQLPKGPKGSKGADRCRGYCPGPRARPGLSGYEVVSQTFKEVYIENSGGMRGLSEVKTVLPGR